MARTGTAARLGPKIAAQLQTQIGNRAVARLVAQRSAPAVDEAETSAPTPRPAIVGVQRLRPGPESDPKFAGLTRDVRAKQHRLGAHPPAKAEAARAQGAAQAPPDDKQAQGKAAQAEKMNAAKPGEFDKAGFIAAVNAAIATKAPQNLSEAKDFGGSGKAAAIKGEVAGKVGSGKQASAAAIETTTKAAPDTSQATDKPVTPLVPDRPPPTPAGPSPANAVPDKAPPEDTDFSSGPRQVDGAMADAQITEDQLARSNEPEFTGALQDKKEGEEHSATAPAQLRANEAQTLGAAKADAAATGGAAMASMSMSRRVSGAAVTAGKNTTKGADESRRATVTATLQKVFDATRTEVEAILGGIDAKVGTAFDTGEKDARDAFTSEHTQKMDDYKDRRYSGLRGKGRWIRDKFAGLPAEASQIFVTARQGYVDRMKQVISTVADLIAGELGRAKARIAQGREELQAEVKRLPKDLQALGKQTAGELGEKFDGLTESVDSKGSELVQTLASRYTEALGKVDEEIEAEKEKNKGLIAKAIDAVGGVIRTILQLKDLLLGALAKAAQAVTAIISDPIGFLGNLVSAVGAGLSAFMSRIGEHLQGGLVSWLLGSASEMGIQLPEKFDLRGILMMIGSMLGLTWDAIKARVITRGVPAQAIELAEGRLPLIAKLRSEGIGAVWEDIQERVGDLQENLFSKITEYLVPTVLTAGITWIISLLNPASAFIKACKMIIDIITFIVTRGAQIVEFVNSVLDAVIAIAAGGAGGVPALIENALVKSIPVLIGALAAILGVGGIADKVKSFFQSLAKPVLKAVDWITDKIVGVGKKVWGSIKSTGKKIKDKAKAVGAKVKAKVQGGDDSAEGRRRRLELGVDEGVRATDRFAGRSVAQGVLRPVLATIRLRRGLSLLEPVKRGDVWAVHGEVQRMTKPTAARAGGVAVDFSRSPATKLARRGFSRDEITHVFAQSSTDKIKSAIMEGLLARAKAGEAAAAKKSGSGSKAGAPVAEFIAGRRISSTSGRELTDGMDAILGESTSKTPVIKIVKIYEAKSSERQKYKLATEHDRYSRMPTTPDGAFGETEKDRWRREAIDDFIEKYYPEALSDSLTPEEARDAHQAAKQKVLSRFKGKIEGRLKAMYRERSTGQAVRNRQRLDSDVDTATGRSVPVSVMVDGVSRVVVGYSPNRTVTVGVLPADVAPGAALQSQLASQGVKAEFANVGMTAAALSALAAEVRAAQR